MIFAYFTYAGLSPSIFNNLSIYRDAGPKVFANNFISHRSLTASAFYNITHGYNSLTAPATKNPAGKLPESLWD
jgi:hypothetical protein